MALCAHCSTFILFGGKTVGGYRYCSEACKEQGILTQFSQKLPVESIRWRVKQVHEGRCPRCAQNRPVDVHVSYRVWSAVFLTSWQSRPQVSCRPCGKRQKLADAVYCLLLGWWGLPWGPLATLIQLSRNLTGLFFSPEPSRPSQTLEALVRAEVAERVMDEYRARQNGPASDHPTDGNGLIDEDLNRPPGKEPVLIEPVVARHSSPAENLIRDCVRTFGSAPRILPLRDRCGYLKLNKPWWCDYHSSDRMGIVFRWVPKVYRQGRVVWAHLIQANGLLFGPGDQDHAGELVYCLDDRRNTGSMYLRLVARELAALKGTRPQNEDLRGIADYLTDERIRVFGLLVPKAICGDIECRISTTFFARKHLPGQVLRRSHLPAIVFPDDPYVVLPLPERYWPSQLIEWWLE